MSAHIFAVPNSHPPLEEGEVPQVGVDDIAPHYDEPTEARSRRDEQEKGVFKLT